MSNIDIHNYEAFYLDYLENNLGSDDIARLLRFLDDNPGLKAELDDFELVTFDGANAVCDVSFNKARLKQDINSNNIDAYLIAALEHEIDADDREELEVFLADSEDALILAKQYEKTILPIPVLPFPEKDTLKKRNTIVYYMLPLAGAAAVALLIILSGTNNKNTPRIQMSSTYSVDTSTGLKTVKTAKGTAVYEKDVVAVFPETTVQTPVKPEIQEAVGVTPNELYDDSGMNTKQETNLASVLNTDNAQNIEGEQVALQQVKDAITETTDSLLLQNELVAIHGNEDINTSREDNVPGSVEALTLREWVRKLFRKRLLDENEPVDEKLESKAITAALVNKIGESANGIIAYNLDESETRTSFSFNIGKIEFSRSKKR